MICGPNEEFSEIILKRFETLAICLLFIGEILMSRLSTPVIQSFIGERIIQKAIERVLPGVRFIKRA